MYLAILALLIVIFIVYPIVRTKYREHRELKKEAEEKGLKVIPKKKKISSRNGTQQDLSEFISRLISFARKNRLRTIIPATFCYNDEVLRISAIIVGHGRALGIFCLGYGGSVEPDLNRDEWKQKLNGEIKYFKNPLKITEGMDDVVREALRSKGKDVPYRTVCVFTTPDVDVDPVIQDVYTVEGFFYYLETADWVNRGDLDMADAADTLLSFVPMDKIKEAQKDHEKEIKQEQEQARVNEKEAKIEARKAKREERQKGQEG